jgi:hypothetical protein
MTVVPTMGQAVPGNFVTAAFWNNNVKALGDFLLSPPRFSIFATAAVSVASGNSIPVVLDMPGEALDTVAGHSTQLTPAGTRVRLRGCITSSARGPMRAAPRETVASRYW